VVLLLQQRVVHEILDARQMRVETILERRERNRVAEGEERLEQCALVRFERLRALRRRALMKTVVLAGPRAQHVLFLRFFNQQVLAYGGVRNRRGGVAYGRRAVVRGAW